MFKKLFLNFLIIVSIILSVYVFFKQHTNTDNINSSNIKSNLKIKIVKKNRPKRSAKTMDNGEYSNIGERNSGENIAFILKEIEQNKKIKDFKNNNKNKDNRVYFKDGFYENEKYHYEIKFPSNWPVKIYSEEKIAIGQIPPQNGKGAISIKVSSKQEGNELEEAKKQALKYGGIISINEYSVSINDLEGKKIIIKNNISNTETIYILFEKNNFNYLLSYSKESSDFAREAEIIIKTFKILNK